MTNRDEHIEFTRPTGEGYSERRFTAVIGMATVLATVALVSFLSIGMVGAALGVGVGGFVANFDEIDADGGAEIFPVVGEQPACDEAPQLQASLDGTAELSGGVEFFKDLPLPSSTDFGDADIARITIKGQDDGTDPIEVDDLALRLSALETQSLTLRGAKIEEYGPEDYADSGLSGAGGSYIDTTDGGPSVFEGDALDPATGNETTPEFGINAPDGFELNNGTAAAHHVSFGGISLHELNLAVQILDSDNNTRVVEPDSRTCEALADASTVDGGIQP